MTLVALLLHVPLVAGAALLLAGWRPWLAARLEGRAGPPVLQPWVQWRRLLRKRPLQPEGASPAFAACVLACLAAVGATALLTPSFDLVMVTSPASDLVVIAGLLTVSRVALMLAVMDAGFAPGAIAAAAPIRAGGLADAGLLGVALVLAVLTGSTNLAALRDLPASSFPVLLITAGLAALILALETGEFGPLALFSGWHLAAAEAAVAVRRVVWFSLLAALLLPASLAGDDTAAAAWPLAILAWAAKLFLIGTVCAVGGWAMRRARQPNLPLLGTGWLLLLLGLVFLLTGGELA